MACETSSIPSSGSRYDGKTLLGSAGSGESLDQGTIADPGEVGRVERMSIVPFVARLDILSGLSGSLELGPDAFCRGKTDFGVDFMNVNKAS